MFRRKPPQLSLFEELQQTYNDVCDFSIKNLALEEDNRFEEALKGWKGLHTSLLFKCDVFDKQLSKLSNDERNILQDLKNIRDENVKHLIRVQLRIDEQVRRSSRSQSQAQPSSSSSSNNAHNLTVHSLRLSSGSTPRTINSTSNNRSMLKSLRPGGSTGGSSSSHVNKKVPVASQTAANVSWQKPKHVTPSYSTINPVTTSAQNDEENLFNDFDQDSFEFTESNWERVNSIESAKSNNSNSQTNLIDLDDGIGPTAPALRDGQNGNYFVANHNLNTSLDELSLKPKTGLLLPPPPPPPRHRSYNNPPASKSNDNIKPAAAPSKPNHISKSTSDIISPDKASPVKKKYIYNKPKPININHLMKPNQVKKTSSSSVPTIKKTAPASNPVASSQAKPKAKPNPSNFKNTNISYNYKVIPKAGAKPGAAAKAKPVKPTLQPQKMAVKPVAMDSPTMDDILNGYDERFAGNEFQDELIDVDDVVDDPETEGTPDSEEQMTDAQQDELIKSVRGIDPIAAKQILNDIVVRGDEVYWDDIVGLEGAKNSLKEAVVYPFLRPDLFRGLREPTRGMLLFGPPGTGKTMLARAVATESKSTFFSISSSSLTSKYLGESEKLVKALFLLAKKLSPSIVFIDEIDSLLSSRTEGEVESSRRIKNEFLVQWSELSSAAAGRTPSNGNKDDVEDVSRVLILGATNLPWSIDEAARRRFVKRQYIPLPEDETRKAQIMKLLSYQKHTLSDDDFNELIKLTEGFSGSDITALAKDSAMGPLRSLGDKLLTTPTEQIRSINLDDFVQSLKYIRPSVSSEGLEEYEKWAIKFGSSGV